MRALSPGTNDPYTATDVIRRLSQILDELEDRKLPNGVIEVDDQLRLIHDVVTFDELVETMFSGIRRNAAGTVVVYTTLLEQFVALKNLVNDPLRVGLLHAHGEAVYSDAMRTVETEIDKQPITAAYRKLKTVHAVTGRTG
ncbi:hypothetical protein CCHOA_09860 [Corynebacterium choanae]|uniref:Uncharacterized protein n=1 Tax=Corynebacterium choanae TaxID=1862358 RepID=A0A3G6J8C7_9CORY|nr:hypothetical protein CCHOA_09860 [Corynebacterium choanae]